jgi:hypothetical protein
LTAYEYDELGMLIAALPPAPVGWVAAAQALPEARRGIDDIVARALADEAYRKRVVADLESALAEAGVEPALRFLAELRDRLRPI